jgi:magnesium transporter
MKKKPASSPGSLIYTGDVLSKESMIDVIDYDLNLLNEFRVKKFDECKPLKDSKTVSWINVIGLNDLDTIEDFGKTFGIHPLVLEDILNVDQRPKIEDYGDYMFIVLRMITPDSEEVVKSEQVSIILGKNFVISFQERKGDVFDPIRQRIRHSKGKIRSLDADYLAYAIIDSIVDNYFLVLEHIGGTMEALDEALLTVPKPDTLNKIYILKRKLAYLRKSVWPLREVVNKMHQGESPLIHDSTDIYLRDVYDHVIQIADNIESIRDTVGGMIDVYLSNISNRMNEVMKVLTIIATIFIPLTFVAGIYGMNFEFMPELGLWWAYPLVWILMGLITSIMLFYFHMRRWI